MSENVEQRICTKFCYRNDISAADTMRMLEKAFGEQCLSKRNVDKWYKQFKDGREHIIDEGRSGRPSSSINDKHVNEIRDLVEKKSSINDS